ncbi:MAG: hypothetical protein JNM27_14720 [Leptospirales bacterium]|nr:hypothetical protein [Leptospirales bacterium]
MLFLTGRAALRPRSAVADAQDALLRSNARNGRHVNPWVLSLTALTPDPGVQENTSINANQG